MFLGDKQLYALQNTKKMHLVTQCGGPGRNVEVRDAMWRSGTQCGAVCDAMWRSGTQFGGLP